MNLRYVHVLVPQSANWGDLRRDTLYLYIIPPTLADQALLGQAVLVPFGARLVYGMLWSAADDPHLPVDQLREIQEILDPEAVIDNAHRRLAEWLAAAYVCRLADAVRIILPGMTTSPRIDLIGATTAADSASLIAAEDDPETRALLGLLRQQGKADEAMIRRALGPRKAGALIESLETRGAISRAIHTATRRTSTDVILRLVAKPETVSRWRAESLARVQAQSMPSLPRAPIRPARVGRGRGALLRALAATDDPTPAQLVLTSREAVRLRAAIALVDLLASGPRPQREALRITRATPAALALVATAGLIATEAAAPHSTSSAMLGSAPLALNEAQATALAQITAAMDAAIEASLLGDTPPDEELQRACRPILLHGVTGSGKTEVYLQALSAAIARGRCGIVLVPEIALTPQTVSRFAARFPGRVALLHSALRPTERQREWRRIRSGEVDVVIGSRSAIFAPIPELGLIILDEEHDSSYKHDQRPPTYHTRDVAATLGQLTGAAVVLGSATPSIESYHRALEGEFALATLPERATSGASNTEGENATPSELPPVTIVDLRTELHDGHTSILSRELLSAIETTLERGEQAILYLNRRGSATCVLCRDCGYVARCGRCDVPLTHHHREGMLICHYCNWREHPPRICLSCGSNGIRYFGIGTERVEASVRERFPAARVLRWDADTVRAYTDHERFGRALAKREVDILIGTQMIAKGLDVPDVTLVGIIAADVALFLPDYRAPERAFQLLTQVAGRAGRGASPSRVIMQTFSPEHFVLEAAATHNYQAFYQVEIATRQGYGYPPFRRFVKLTYTHKERHACQIEAISLGDHLTHLIDDMHLPDTDIVGPAPAFIERLRDRYRWQMIVRGPDPRAVIAALAPGELGPGWAIDIDPLSSL